MRRKWTFSLRQLLALVSACAILSALAGLWSTRLNRVEVGLRSAGFSEDVTVVLSHFEVALKNLPCTLEKLPELIHTQRDSFIQRLAAEGVELRPQATYRGKTSNGAPFYFTVYSYASPRKSDKDTIDVTLEVDFFYQYRNKDLLINQAILKENEFNIIQLGIVSILDQLVWTLGDKRQIDRHRDLVRQRLLDMKALKLP